MFRDRFWWSLILSIPVVIFSPMVAHLLGYHLPAFPGSTWIPPVLGTIIFVYGGTPFLKGGWKELKSRQPGMMLLIAMAITVAFVASWVTTLGLGGFDLDFWWELALLVTIMLLGHWLEMSALGAASSALDALAALLPDEAEKVIDGTTHTVTISELVVDDVVLVRAGARVPADGTILDGAAEFDEAMITGESRPVFRDTGDKVVAGTVATDNTVRIRVEATGGGTALAGIPRMGAHAHGAPPRGPIAHKGDGRFIGAKRRTGQREAVVDVVVGFLDAIAPAFGIAGVVDLVQDHQGAPRGGNGAVLEGVHAHLGIGHHDAVHAGVDRRGVREGRIQGQAHPRGGGRPLRLQVLGRHHDDDAFYRAVFHKLRRDAQSKGGFTRTWGRHGHKILWLGGEEFIEG